MIDSVRFEREKSKVDIQTSDSSGTSTTDPVGNILCTHDGVLLKKAGAEHIADLNTSGALSIVEYTPPRRLYIEWRPNDNILIADDSQEQEDWALVDTISRRSRTTSECKIFNTKPGESTGSVGGKTRIIRTQLEELSSIEVKHRGQIIRFIRKSDGSVHSEFFFQHGNADIFVRSMRQLHIIEYTPSSRNGEEYIILTTETQKLKKTFAELDIGEIKASSIDNESWLPNKVVGFLANFPEYVQPPFHRGQPKNRPGAIDHLKLSPDNYQIVGIGDSNTTTCSDSQSRGSSIDKSPIELENIKETDEKMPNPLPERRVITRGAPLNENQWREFQTPDGCISDPTRVKEIIFRGGIQSELRNDVWKYLLNYYQWNDTTVERELRRKSKSVEYYKMKAQWLSMSTVQEANFSGYRDRKCQIEKDVKRTDRTLKFFAGEDNQNLLHLQNVLQTYVMYNFDLGYVQGMSDLLAPILAIEENDQDYLEVDAFWCFVGFMDMVFGNFDMDQAGMKTQFNQLRCLLEFANPRLFNYMRQHDSDNMYFCFRWLLVWYKREFSNDDVIKLWECLWTHLPCTNFHLFLSVAILDQHTDTIIDSEYEFTEILKHVNELSGNIDLQRTLQIAEAIYEQIKESNYLTNDVRKIIGEPLVEPMDGGGGGGVVGDRDDDEQQDFDDGFDTLVRELSPEERQQQQEQLEEACERSMFLQYL